MEKNEVLFIVLCVVLAVLATAALLAVGLFWPPALDAASSAGLPVGEALLALWFVRPQRKKSLLFVAGIAAAFLGQQLIVFITFA